MPGVWHFWSPETSFAHPHMLCLKNLYLWLFWVCSDLAVTDHREKRQISGTKFGASQARPLLEAGAGIQSTCKTSQHLWSAIEHLRSVIQHLLEVPGLGSGM